MRTRTRSSAIRHQLPQKEKRWRFFLAPTSAFFKRRRGVYVGGLCPVRFQGGRISQPQCFDRSLETLRHDATISGEITRETVILKLHPFGSLMIDLAYSWSTSVDSKICRAEIKTGEALKVTN